MATDLEPHKTTSKSEAYLQRQFAEICARIRRVDILHWLLTLALSVCCYALIMGVFNLFSSGADSTSVQVCRWSVYVAFVGSIAFLLARTLHCVFRPINPFYVARQLERTLPNAKNSLINWLDLHEEDLPAAFQRNLTANAIEHFKGCDPQQTVQQRKTGIMLGVLALLAVGLVGFMILFPMAFFASMRQAFVPFLRGQSADQTQITILLPEKGDAEVSPAQAVTFAAKIEGRVPTGNRPDAPHLHYRYQENEDFLTLALQPDGDGAWTAQMQAAQLRTGFTYKISAGDAVTPEFQVRVRSRAHVQQYDVTYDYRPYLRLAKRTTTFPNEHASRPMISGPRGTEVALVMRASRPVRQATVEMLTTNTTKDLPVRKLPDDPHGFTCRFTLEQPAQFRVIFISSDGEENTDRDPISIDVVDDEAPRVVLSMPGKDLSLPENDTLVLEGLANDDIGLKHLALHLRVIEGPAKPFLPARPYRSGKSFQRADGTYPNVIEYKDFVALDQLKDSNGTIQYLPPGTVLQYWLEATDNADYPNKHGNVGKSLVYKLMLLPAAKDGKQLQTQRQRLDQQQKQHEKQQDDRLAKENKQHEQSKGGSGHQNLQEQIQQKEKETQGVKDQISTALKQEQQPNAGDSNQAKPNPGASKPGPKDPSDKPNAEKKKQPPMAPNDAGNNKDQGGANGSSGESKAGGEKGPGKEPPPKGERKDGPKEASSPAKDNGGMDKKEPEAGAKDGGPMGMNAPSMPQPKETTNGEDAPMPQVKQDMQKESHAKEGVAKSAEPDASAVPNKTQQPSTENPMAMPKESSWDDIAKLVGKLSDKGESGNAAAKELSDIAKQSSDERKRGIAKEVLEKNQRDPSTGKQTDTKPMPGPQTKPATETKKGPNQFGSYGQSPGIGDDLKAAAANREFARKIGQMQLDDWKKRMTPSLLKKAGLSEAQWQRFLSDMQAYDKLVRQWNSQLAKRKTSDKQGNRTSNSAGPVLIEGPATSDGPLDRIHALPPPDLREAQRRFSTRQTGP